MVSDLARTRKQREIRQREALILDVARKVLRERGYHDLTMERIARAIEYSKGTIYQHFSSREDILVALVVEESSLRNAMFRRAAAFEGRPRERYGAMILAYELFFRLHPVHFTNASLAHSVPILSKASDARQNALLAGELSCLELAGTLISDAVSCGDLVLAEGVQPQELSFSLWSLQYGTFRILASEVPVEFIGIGDPFATLRRATRCLLDGYGWRPLSNAWDYDETTERILKQVFPEEASQVR